MRLYGIDPADFDVPVFSAYRHPTGRWSILAYGQRELSRRAVYRAAAIDEPMRCEFRPAVRCAALARAGYRCEQCGSRERLEPAPHRQSAGSVSLQRDGSVRSVPCQAACRSTCSLWRSTTTSMVGTLTRPTKPRYGCSASSMQSGGYSPNISMTYGRGARCSRASGSASASSRRLFCLSTSTSTARNCGCLHPTTSVKTRAVRLLGRIICALCPRNRNHLGSAVLHGPTSSVACRI